MTTVPTPFFRPIIENDRVVVGAPVAAPRQWTDVAQAANWCRGKGACLVPSYSMNTAITLKAEQVFRFRVKPRLSAIQRIWTVNVYIPATGSVASSEIILRAPATTGTARTYSGGQWVPMVYVENLSVQSDTETEITIGVEILGADAAAPAYVTVLECHEQDRPLLVDGTTDDPVNLETVRPRAPIQNLAGRSIGGTLDLLAAMDARRVGIFHYAVPASITRTSAVNADLFAFQPRVQAPKINIGATTHQVYWSAYASMSTGGGSGSVTISLTSGASASHVFTSTTAGWSTPTAITMSCDDFSADDGGVSESLRVQLKGDGVRAILFRSISMWVADVS